MSRIHRTEGRRLFGVDPDGYDRARPDYPTWVFDALVSSGALFEDAITLEIGPGTGLATRHLIERGANPITLIEPDERLAHRLASSLAAGKTREDRNCTVRAVSFEDAELPDQHFDLVAAATAFHWINPITGLAKARQILKPGGFLALFWNVFQDLDKPDPFHEATRALLSPLADSPSGAPDTVPFALDRANREAEASRAGFNELSYEESRWTLTLDAEAAKHLYGNFSSIQRLPPAEKDNLLDALTEIAQHQFNGRITRNMTTCLYLFRCPISSPEG